MMKLLVVYLKLEFLFIQRIYIIRNELLQKFLQRLTLWHHLQLSASTILFLASTELAGLASSKVGLQDIAEFICLV